MRIGASGIVRSGTGIGVLQTATYPLLRDLGIDLVESLNRDIPHERLGTLRGVIRGFTPARGKFDAYLSTVPPLPLLIRVPIVTVIYDLRWTKTRRWWAKFYRKWDLRRTVDRSSALICISERTRNDLIGMFPKAAAKSSVAWLGPGLAEEPNKHDADVRRELGTALLIGGAPHKRNDLAGDMLIAHKSGRVRHVIGVGIPSEVRVTIDSVPNLTSEWHDNVSNDDMRRLYRRSEYFILLSVSEGFGLPFIEASSLGCNVVAIRQPLTVELLEDSAILCEDGDSNKLAQQFDRAALPNPDARAAVGARYSWKTFTEHVVAQLAHASSLR